MKKTNMQNRQEKKISRNSHRPKIWGIFLMPLLSIIAIIPKAMAHCPLCTAATVVGVGVTRSLGWDDSIVGIFVGAVIVSSALWLNKVVKKRSIGGNAFLRIGSITVATLALTIVSFYYAGIVGPANTYRIFGMEKILFGTISGAAVSFAAFLGSNELKKRNEGKALFNYQTMVITFGALILNALAFWTVFR